MRKRTKKSRRNRQQGNQACGRKAFKVEQLEARRMMCGDGSPPRDCERWLRFTPRMYAEENADCEETVYCPQVLDEVTDDTGDGLDTGMCIRCGGRE